MSALDLVDVAIPWPTAIVIVVALSIPQIGGWISTARAGQASRRAIKALTTNNGGSHVRDQLDRIEGCQQINTTAIEQIVTRLDEHDSLLEGIRTDTSAIRIDQEN
ncbi:hypothetical protein [Agrococcus casei]|uniref:hypothetical protein n=1 Tax=Agrococcus casei TaxID=343512 RepID=UPI003F9A12CF